MSATRLVYFTGQEIHVGDRVRHAGLPGRVVAAPAGQEYSPEYPAEAWSEYTSGFLIRCDDGQLLMYDEANEDIELVSRAE